MKLNAATAILVSSAMLGAMAHAHADEKRLRWNVASSYASSLPTLGSLGPRMAERVKQMSGGNFTITVHEAGALVPALGVFDAVSKGSIDAGFSTPSFWAGHDTAFSLFNAIPFVASQEQYLGWYFYGGGKELLNEFYAPFGIHSIPCGIIGPESGGWFNKEVNTSDDFNGLQMRFAGLGAQVVEKLGATTHLMGVGDVVQGLQLGTIDAAEVSSPKIDMQVGMHQVAKYLYFPGWHAPFNVVDLIVPKAKWDELSEARQAQLEVACGDNFRDGAAETDQGQGEAVDYMVSKGVQLRRYPPEVMQALEEKWLEVVAEEGAKNPNFKKAWDSFDAYKSANATWVEVTKGR